MSGRYSINSPILDRSSILLKGRLQYSVYKITKVLFILIYDILSAALYNKPLSAKIGLYVTIQRQSVKDSVTLIQYKYIFML